jgi:GTP pyrophosphokinase
MIRKIEKFAEKLSFYPPQEQEKIIQATRWAESMHRSQNRASGEPYFIHPLQVAEILVDMKMDYESIIAALLHDILEDTKTTRDEMESKFGTTVESLVNGVTKISIVKAKSKSIQESESIRKMLFAMVKDIRVILIKLADKLHNMRTLEYLPQDKRKSIARECLDIYAPLAGRLGISWVKTELEDLSLKHLNPPVYDQIKGYLAVTRNQRAQYLENVEKTIYGAAREEDLSVEIESRAKHFYSIYLKMKRRDKALDEIYDLLGMRILCKTESECYTVLGMIHRLWKPIEGRFKDYIAMPKANKYQSLHTTIMCNEGKLLEIQIRTYQMHQTAEYGIAAHWIYKQHYLGEEVKPKDLAIINKLRDWDGRNATSGEFLEEIKREILQDSIYVFTPNGDIIELPRGASAIDFAYHIHTEVGNSCYAAKADGVIIPLHQELKNTQVIEIVTSSKAHPHVNWLRYATTSRARSKIRHWLNKNDDSVILDRSIIAKKRPPAPQPQAQTAPPDETEEDVVKEVRDYSRVAFKIGNERNMMIHIAQCCRPSTGDDIIGYISRGRGIIVHKKSCPNLKNIREFNERSIPVEWEAVSPKTTRRFKVTAKRTSDLFSEIEGAVRKYKGHLIEGRLEENEQGNLSGNFTMELEQGDDFKKVIKSIRTIPSIMNIQQTNFDYNEQLIL